MAEHGDKEVARYTLPEVDGVEDSARHVHLYDMQLKLEILMRDGSQAMRRSFLRWFADQVVESGMRHGVGREEIGELGGEFAKEVSAHLSFYQYGDNLEVLH